MGWLIDGKGSMFISSPSEPLATDGDEGTASPGLWATPHPTQTGPTEQRGGTLQAPPQNLFNMPDAKNLDKPLRRIAEIRVFYDDGTFETFTAKQ